MRIAERFFTVAEYTYINDTQTEEEKSIRLLRVWTEKEAYLKLTGDGMSRPLHSFDVFDVQAKNQTMIFENYFCLFVHLIRKNRKLRSNIAPKQQGSTNELLLDRVTEWR